MTLTWLLFATSSWRHRRHGPAISSRAAVFTHAVADANYCLVAVVICWPTLAAHQRIASIPQLLPSTQMLQWENSRIVWHPPRTAASVGAVCSIVCMTSLARLALIEFTLATQRPSTTVLRLSAGQYFHRLKSVWKSIWAQTVVQLLISIEQNSGWTFIALLSVWTV